MKFEKIGEYTYCKSNQGGLMCRLELKDNQYIINVERNTKFTLDDWRDVGVQCKELQKAFDKNERVEQIPLWETSQ